MAITLNHTLVPAHDKDSSAHWLADLLELRVEDRSPTNPSGRFAVVRVGETSLDFADAKNFQPHHYAFLVIDVAFDSILARVKDRGLPYAADPAYQKPGVLNHYNGGRGVYFRDPNGHNLELLTRA